MNNKGFTLVELIAVIGLLGIIMIIAIPTITNVSANIKESNLENKKEVIKSTVLNYANDYELDIIKKDGNNCQNNDDCCKYYSIDEIIDNGIYTPENTDNTITNPVTNKQLIGKVKVCYDINKFKLVAEFIDKEEE